jgi:hypothetical protein
MATSRLLANTAGARKLDGALLVRDQPTAVCDTIPKRGMK